MGSVRHPHGDAGMLNQVLLCGSCLPKTHKASAKTRILNPDWIIVCICCDLRAQTGFWLHTGQIDDKRPVNPITVLLTLPSGGVLPKK